MILLLFNWGETFEVRDTLDRSACAVPTWGAFRGIASGISKETFSSDAPEGSNRGSEKVEGGSAPAFNLNDVPVDAETSFYADVGSDRNEIEFDALGEGALRQIGRNFISVLGSVSAIGLAIGSVLWIFSEAPMDPASVIASNVSGSELVATISNPDYFVSSEADVDVPLEIESAEAYVIDLDIPVPSVIEASQSEGNEPMSVVKNGDDKNPTPISRQVALASFASVEDGPLAQGSDDESVLGSSIQAASLSGAGNWVSILMPVDRPAF